MELIVKYWKGLMKFENMDKNWLEHWRDVAFKTENEGCELVVFKIPKNKIAIMADPYTIEEIEKLLQSKFDKS